MDDVEWIEEKGSGGKEDITIPTILLHKLKNRPPKRKKSRPKMKQASQRRKAIVGGSDIQWGGWRCERMGVEEYNAFR
jgi:hypothetical protein